MGKRRGLQLAVLVTLLGGLLVAVAAEAQDELFVADLGNNSITVYSRTASGNTAPLRTLSGAATGLNIPEALALATGAAPTPTSTPTPTPTNTPGGATPTATPVGPGGATVPTLSTGMLLLLGAALALTALLLLRRSR